ncbi:MAG: hypothetical protein LBM67_08425 [Lentimicrobiaceae bacterium]|jgi:hypothetical protein|nr:hypothetical protein [Lentimicrobiaceae bacterium]
MKILTKDNKLLELIKIGKNDSEGSDELTCFDDKLNKVILKIADVAMFFGSYTFLSNDKK